ncbi:NAD(P)H-dependent glycerol-3-phosphate dehydrogenase [Hyphomonas sp.]|uniref:NAD(P)H-dependent glycerol-3-phosphate dehydrogenase n=1 Tax=Hyphomonas sp. TaxID=87 RepID=UPI00391A2933
MTMHFKTFGVIGAGAWGTAIAQMLAREGQSVLLWAREPEVADAINAQRENTVFLSGVALKPEIRATTRLDDLGAADAIFAVAPAQHTRATLRALAPALRPGTPVVLCSKGIELSSRKFMTDVLAEELPGALPAVMSGPSFAIDVARGLPTAVTLAVADAGVGAELIQAISTPTFRPYLGTDLLGTEIGGSVKNVLAIACGIALGKGLGRSAHAALIARGYAEMTRLALALGAEAETLTGLSGLGDLVLTCSSETSRNMSLGLALGRGEALETILGARHTVAEGVATAPVLRELARAKGIEMPICEAVATVIEGETSVDEAILGLLLRPVKAEAR